MSALSTLVRLGIELAADLVRDALRERRTPQPPRPTASVRDVNHMAEDARTYRPTKPD